MYCKGKCCKLVCVRMCVKVSVCSNLFVRLCVRLSESVKMFAYAVLKTLIGKAMQLYGYNSLHILYVIENSSMYKNVYMGANMVRDNCICERA